MIDMNTNEFETEETFDVEAAKAKHIENVKESCRQGLKEANSVLSGVLEALNENPEFEQNLALIADKYSHLLINLCKPIVDYTMEKEIDLCTKKYDKILYELGKHCDLNRLTQNEHAALAVACFGRK